MVSSLVGETSEMQAKVPRRLRSTNQLREYTHESELVQRSQLVFPDGWTSGKPIETIPYCHQKNIPSLQYSLVGVVASTVHHPRPIALADRSARIIISVSLGISVGPSALSTLLLTQTSAVCFNIILIKCLLVIVKQANLSYPFVL